MTNTSSLNNDHLEVMGKFGNSGLPEFKRFLVECWSNFELRRNCSVSQQQSQASCNIAEQTNFTYLVKQRINSGSSC